MTWPEQQNPPRHSAGPSATRRAQIGFYPRSERRQALAHRSGNLEAQKFSTKDRAPWRKHPSARDEQDNGHKD